MPDPRGQRGVRHHIAMVLTVMVLAVLTGARNFREAGSEKSGQRAVVAVLVGCVVWLFGHAVDGIRAQHAESP